MGLRYLPLHHTIIILCVVGTCVRLTRMLEALPIETIARLRDAAALFDFDAHNAPLMLSASLFDGIQSIHGAGGEAALLPAVAAKW